MPEAVENIFLDQMFDAILHHLQACLSVHITSLVSAKQLKVKKQTVLRSKKETIWFYPWKQDPSHFPFKAVTLQFAT